MKTTRRIASDARYVIASIALVTSLGVFASLGSMHRHEMAPSEWTAAPAAPMVVTTTTSQDLSDCTCGTTPMVEPPESTSPAPPVASDTTSASTDDCTCSAADPTTTTPAQTTTPDSDNSAVQSSDSSSTTTVNVTGEGIVVQTSTTSKN